MKHTARQIHYFLFTAMLLVSPLISQADAENDRFIIEAYGGSSTQGAMAVREHGKVHTIFIKNNEVNLLNQFLAEKYGSGIHIVNKGASSAQAMDLLNGRYFYRKNKTWREEMKRSPARIILLNFATNDARHYHFNDIEPDYRVSPEKYIRVMSQLISIARQEGKEVIVQEPHPLCGRAEKWNVAPYVARLEDLSRAESVPLVRQYQRILDMKAWRSLMSPDCVHPSEALYRIKAEATFAVLVENVNRQLAAATH